MIIFITSRPKYTLISYKFITLIIEFTMFNKLRIQALCYKTFFHAHLNREWQNLSLGPQTRSYSKTACSATEMKFRLVANLDILSNKRITKPLIRLRGYTGWSQIPEDRFSMESQPQNHEFRNNPENFHQCKPQTQGLLFHIYILLYVSFL